MFEARYYIYVISLACSPHLRKTINFDKTSDWRRRLWSLLAEHILVTQLEGEAYNKN
jgi:hypothetical protein